MARTPGRRSAAPRKRPRGPDGTYVSVRYSEDVADEICTRIAMGEAWYQMCSTGRMPAYGTLYQWMGRYPDFAEAVARARQMAADYKADKALVVAEATTPATVSADRLKVSTLMKHAALQAPGQWGRKAEARGEDRRIVIVVRDFVPVLGPDGVLRAQEVLPPETEEEGDED